MIIVHHLTIDPYLLNIKQLIDGVSKWKKAASQKRKFSGASTQIKERVFLLDNA